MAIAYFKYMHSVSEKQALWTQCLPATAEYPGNPIVVGHFSQAFIIHSLTITCSVTLQLSFPWFELPKKISLLT